VFFQAQNAPKPILAETLSGPRWGSLRRFSRPPSRLGRGTPPPHSSPPSTPSASQSWRLRCIAASLVSPLPNKFPPTPLFEMLDSLMKIIQLSSLRICLTHYGVLLTELQDLWGLWHAIRPKSGTSTVHELRERIVDEWDKLDQRIIIHRQSRWRVAKETLS